MIGITKERKLKTMAIVSTSRKDVVIYPNKVYTSYFAVVDKWVPYKRQVSMSFRNPFEFRGTTFEELIPPKDLHLAFKNGEITEALYIDIYRDNILSMLNPVEVYERLSGMVLCSWEKKNSFNARFIVTDWLRDTLGPQFIGGEL